MSDDDITVPDTNEVDIDRGLSQRKKIVTTYMKGAVRAAEKIKKKYKKQRIGQPNKQNKKATDWLQQAGYLETKDLKTMNYDNSNITDNNAKTKIDISEKKTSNAQIAAKNIVKKYKNLARKKPYSRPLPKSTVDIINEEVSNNEDTINDLDTIANLQPGRNVQIAAKKINEKYKK